MKREPDIRYVVPKDLTDEQIVEAREKLRELAGLLGRISAQACHDMGIQFDMDDPEVAREVMKLTVEALFLSTPRKARTSRKAPAQAPADLPE